MMPVEKVHVAAISVAHCVICLKRNQRDWRITQCIKRIECVGIATENAWSAEIQEAEAGEAGGTTPKALGSKHKLRRRKQSTLWESDEGGSEDD